MNIQWSKYTMSWVHILCGQSQSPFSYWPIMVPLAVHGRPKWVRLFGPCEVPWSKAHPVQWCGLEYSQGLSSNSGWWFFGTFFIFPYVGNNHSKGLVFFIGVAQPPTRICNLDAPPGHGSMAVVCCGVLGLSGSGLGRCWVSLICGQWTWA